MLYCLFLIQTRFPQLRDPERLRPHVEEFLERVNLTDAIILYTPGQVSLLLKFEYFLNVFHDCLFQRWSI